MRGTRRPFDERTFQGMGIVLDRLPRNRHGVVQLSDKLARQMAAFCRGERSTWADIELGNRLEESQ